MCEDELPLQDILAHASNQVKRNIKYIQTNEVTICPNCISSYVQMNRIIVSEQRLYNIYTRSFKLHEYSWSKECHRISLASKIDILLDINLHKGDYLLSDLICPIEYRTISVRNIIQDYENTATSISGVGLPENVHVSDLEANIITRPEHCFGFIKLPRKKDFIVIVKSHFTDLSILEQSLNEMKSISEGVISPRAGAAGGVMTPYKTCRSLSQVTQKERILWYREKSVGMSVTYRNHNGEIKGRNAIYNDLYMKRYSSRQKFKLALKSIAYQRILISEMISRLRSFFILEKEGLLPIELSLTSFKTYDINRKKYLSTRNYQLQCKIYRNWNKSEI